MARILPADWLHSAYLHDGEKETIGWLADALSDEFTIWAGVEWVSREQNGSPVYGEIDLLVVGPSGNVVMIEQKNGALFVDEAGHLKKAYGTKEKSVGKQLRHSFTAFLKQWEDAYGKHESKPYITTLMYLPDHRVENVASLQLDRAQLVDSTRAKQLPEILEDILDHRNPNPHKRQRVLDFLDSQLSLAVDIGAALENQDKVYRTQGNRLAHFVETLSFTPWRLHVQGTAGSGKTQLAASVYGRALKGGRRPLYVCFNRPLADRLAHILPKAPAGGRAGMVVTVDRLTELYAGETAAPAASYQQMDARFQTLRAAALAAAPKAGWQFDTVIVDEGQDFSAQQAAFVEHLLAPGGALLWMADSRQQLYAREDAAAPRTTVRMDLRENLRCGRAIVDYTNTLLRLDPPDIAAGAVQGEMPELIVLENDGELLATVERQVRQLVRDGYEATDIAIVSGMGLERSQLVKQETIAGFHTRHFDGYDDEGSQRYSTGLLRVDTVYRFKGLQAAAVIFAEIDFEAITPAVINRLYTGMTRARSSLTLIVSKRARDLLMARLEGK